MKLQPMNPESKHRIIRTLFTLMICIKAGSVGNTIAQGTKPAWQYKSGEIQIPAATADEPLMGEFNVQSMQHALKYLDDGAVAWTRERKCVACHSTGVYLAERTQLTAQFGPPKTEVRDGFANSIPAEAPVATEKDGVKVYPDVIFSIWRTLGLAQWDRFVTGKLSIDTEKSLKDMFARQSENGLWTTTTKVEIPYITTDFELALEALRAALSAPGWLQSLHDEKLVKQFDLLKSALKKYHPRNDYERIQKLQLHNLMPELVSDPEVETALSLLTKLQKSDGGWSTRTMSSPGNWGDNITTENIKLIESEPDAGDPSSDAYMTAYSIVTMREHGVPANDIRIQKGLNWLKKNQRASGRWWMKSLYKTTQHYITYIATAQVMRAFVLCDEPSTKSQNPK
jgi:squalene-hopene/tetraprenyl-beta-curcumene cyclase